ITFIDKIQLNELIDLMFACLKLNHHERPTFPHIYIYCGYRHAHISIISRVSDVVNQSIPDDTVPLPISQTSDNDNPPTTILSSILKSTTS
ncbi:unnamed protein product, partial [Adineta steineri]